MLQKGLQTLMGLWHTPVQLPAGIWVWAPVLLWLTPYGIHLAVPDVYQTWFTGEHGIVENLTVLFLAMAVLSGIQLFLNRHAVPSGVLVLWFSLLTLGCFFFMGEEISWGQHYWGWETPEALQTLNYQGETNLHNLGEGDFRELTLTSPKLWFSVIPRTLLGVAVFAGGVVAPLWFLRRRRSQPLSIQDNSVSAWLWPSFTCLPVALLATFTTYPYKISKLMGLSFPEAFNINHSELKECLFALFLLMYLASRLNRARAGLKTQAVSTVAVSPAPRDLTAMMAQQDEVRPLVRNEG